MIAPTTSIGSRLSGHGGRTHPRFPVLVVDNGVAQAGREDEEPAGLASADDCLTGDFGAILRQIDYVLALSRDAAGG